MADHILDKGYPVLATYNASAVAGVTQFRVVKLLTTGFIDLAVTAVAATGNIGVVQENVDQAKVATGKAVVDVRIMGVSKVVVQTAAGITLGTRVMCGSAGGAIAAATTGSEVLGFVVGTNSSAGTVGAGDIIDVLLTPKVLF